jgi:light-regulated signal transduction histidine kinase (bacteriophytochrome)
VGRANECQEEIASMELVNDVIQSLAPPPQITIVIENTLPVIHGNQIRIMQVFQNLISNAIKYMDKHQGLITITGEDQEKCWLCFVSQITDLALKNAITNESLRYSTPCSPGSSGKHRHWFNIGQKNH